MPKLLHKIATIETWPIGKLELWGQNPRGIKQDRYRELKARLQRQGQIKPLLATPTGTVIGGNMRLRAMQELGFTEVLVAIQEAKNDKEIFDIALTDNEEFGYYEAEAVAELAVKIGIDLPELGKYEINLGEPITLTELLNRVGPEDEIIEEDVPEVEETEPPESVLGEVYQLGRHRLLCGDSTDLGAISDLLDGVEVDMVLTDPPYNQSHSGGGFNNTREGWSEHKQDQLNDFDPQQMFEVFDTLGTPSGYFFCNKGLLKQYLDWANTFNGWELLVMGKNNPIPTKHKKFLSDIEYIVFVRRENAQFDDSLEYDYYRKVRMINVQERQHGHPTEKQINFLVPYIKISSGHGGTVLDMFGGSGTTLMACEQINRTCYMVELDPRYCDVIRKRYANHAGQGTDWQAATPAVGQGNG